MAGTPRHVILVCYECGEKVRVLMTVSSTGLDGPGPKPEPYITPEPEWVDKPAP